jgi:2-iminobutanoate/2-iminopropanoate deaminase
MGKKIINVEPFASYAAARKIPVSPVVVHNGIVYISQMPPYDPVTGEIKRFELRVQMQIILSQMKACLDAAGSSMEKIIQCGLYCNNPAHFTVINEEYGRFFPSTPPGRKLIFVSGWHGPFDVEVDCIAEE